MADFALSIATPERELSAGRATEARIPCRDGEITVLPGHAPLLSELGDGVLAYTSSGAVEVLAVLGGFVEVLGDKVRVLADSAKRRDEIDLTAAKQELEAAERELSKPADSESSATAQVRAVSRARALVNAASRT